MQNVAVNMALLKNISNEMHTMSFCYERHAFESKFSHLEDAFVWRDLQMMTMEAIRINKRAMICKRYNKSQLA